MCIILVKSCTLLGNCCFPRNGLNAPSKSKYVLKSSNYLKGNLFLEAFMGKDLGCSTGTSRTGRLTAVNDCHLQSSTWSPQELTANAYTHNTWRCQARSSMSLQISIIVCWNFYELQTGTNSLWMVITGQLIPKCVLTDSISKVIGENIHNLHSLVAVLIKKRAETPDHNLHAKLQVNC